ncbi:hypothetical protein BT96DRAFT_680744 [Gymnopus androsaceus JB14]|uniref:Uncharacterized protein n=1 Tax=Gymnopus androsaceus JB14 TaxID=1447944 RepID=A0A6A4HPQ6_9AGAR|nr:hypothetical protein BT96DRAFT_680744 [Gymnopus androsaceus JB14]
MELVLLTQSLLENLQVICFLMSCHLWNKHYWYLSYWIKGLVLKFFPSHLNILLTFYLREFRRYIRMNTGGKGKSTVIQRCLDLMTETGILYCILQFTFLMLNSVQSSNNEPSGGAMDIATHLIIEAAIVIGAIYPILTVILVLQSRSIAATSHVREPGSTGSSANDPSIQFGTNSIATVDFRTNDSYSGTNLFHMSMNSSKV